MGFSWGTSVIDAPWIRKFIEVAKEELRKEFKEGNIDAKGEGDNITPYGIWYGDNGIPWCAIFVSWCANQAGILGKIVSRYSNCGDGANNYKASTDIESLDILLK